MAGIQDQRPSSPPTRSLQLLVADDSPDIRDALVAIFSRLDDVTVLAVCNGHEAVSAASASHFDVAVLDVRMPGGGPDLLRRLRSRQPNMILLVFSSETTAAVIDALGDAGASKILSKSDGAELVATVLRWQASKMATQDTPMTPDGAHSVVRAEFGVDDDKVSGDGDEPPKVGTAE